MEPEAEDPFLLLPPEDQAEINRRCADYEARCRTGAVGRAEDCAAEAPVRYREVLLRELLVLECEYRFRAHAPPTVDELRSRLPGRSDLIRGLLPEAVGTPGHAAAAELEEVVRHLAERGFHAREVLGRGGVGVVFLADTPRLGGLVAVKATPPHRTTDPESRAQTLREARASRLPPHPNVVPVLEVGEAGPVWYVATEYVPGPDLARWLHQQPGPVPAEPAARIARAIAAGVDHAHRAGVLHCDLKPGNVIVAHPAAAEPLPRVTDFGLSRVETGATVVTETLAFLGTPAYMSPELVRGGRAAATPRSDVYALGAILYELLTRSRPFPPGTTGELLVRVATGRPVPLESLRPDAPGDLVAVCERCLEPDAARRYPTAAELVQDLDRFLGGERTLARPPGPLGRARRWSRRHPLRSLSAAVVAVGVAAAGVGLVAHEARLSSTNRDLAGALGERDSVVAALSAERDRLSRETAARRLRLYPVAIRRAREFAERNELAEMREALRGWDDRSGEEDLRGFEWHYLPGRAGAGQVGELRFGSDVYHVAASPDGTLLAASCGDGVVRVCSVTPFKVVRELRHTKAVSCSAFGPGGVVAAASGSTVRVWSERGTATELGGHSAKVHEVSFDAAGDLLTGSDDGTVRRWRLTDSGWDAAGTPWNVGEGVRAVAPLADGSWVVGTAAGRVLIRGPGGGAEQLARLPPVVASVDVSADGRSVAVCGRQGDIRIWTSSPGGAGLSEVAAGDRGVTLRHAVAVENGAVAVGDMVADVFTGPRLARQSRLCGHEGCVWTVRRVAPGRIATGGADGTLRLWDLAAASDAVTVPLDRSARRVAFVEEGRVVLAFGEGVTTVALGDSSTPGPRRYRATPGWVAGVAVTPREQVVTAGGRYIGVWPVGTFTRGSPVPAGMGERSRLWLGDPDKFPPFAAVSSDGQFAAERDGEYVQVWRVADGSLFRRLGGHAAAVTALAFGPGGVLASGSHDRSVIIWDLAAGKPRSVCKGHRSRIESLAFSPDGALLASGSRGASVRVWDVAAGAERFQLLGLQSLVASIAFSPDGRTLATGSANGSVRLWQTRSGDELLHFTPDTVPITDLAFSPNGRVLAAVASGAHAPASRLHFWVARTPSE